MRVKKKIHQFNSKLTFTGLFCKGNIRFWHSQLWTLGTNGFRSSVLAFCNFSLLKLYNLYKVQKYPFGINGLINLNNLGAKNGPVGWNGLNMNVRIIMQCAHLHICAIELNQNST